MVFCKNCKNLKLIDNLYVCHSPGNIVKTNINWFSYKIECKKTPYELNKNNNCQLYKRGVNE